MQIEFNSSDRSSLGVEMELAVVDRDTGELVSVASELLDELESAGHTKAKHELLECTVEIITDVCSTASEARADLESTLGALRATTDKRDLELMCAGTHPFSDWAKQQISPDPRYHALVEEMQWLARRLQIFGIHVHVGIRSPEKAIAIANAMAGYIPHFLALSASSPYWVGVDTGLASARSKVFEGLPTAGLPYQLDGWPEFEQFMTTLVCSNTIRTIREVWWDIRPHPNFGTIELRICDGAPTMAEVAAIAALSQCLVEWMDGLDDKGYTLPRYRSWVLRENKWRAARHGIDAEIVTDEDGSLRPVREAIAEVVEELMPVANRLDCVEELQFVAAMAERPSYQRQRQIVAEGGTVGDVVHGLVAELRTDQPGAR
ncbi:MAG: glutamate---cysteine ligase / carboxylate-amine ligase [Acidimicrobiaceae bacterium]|nr:glutamate---cysteine ligase / carboxylate-amine ligase [Acidimicrobiaceae bacterium]